MRLNRSRLAAHWKKLLIIPVGAAVAAGLAIVLPASVASTHRTAGSVRAQPNRASSNVSAVIAQTAQSAGCRVTYTPTSWRDGFTARVTIHNRSRTRINGWTLTFTFPGHERISAAWNTTFTQNGANVSATNTNYNATIPPAASLSLGFLGTGMSGDTSPTSFSVNGTACS